MKGKGKRSHCKVIISDWKIDAVAYEMSVEIQNGSDSSSASSSTNDAISSGLMFNVQEVDGVSHDDRDGQPTVTPRNYQFVFIRFVNQVIEIRIWMFGILELYIIMKPKIFFSLTQVSF